jgi:ferric-dicitrate binding protein FerR (iron transport regulator)
LPDRLRDARWLDEQRQQLDVPPTAEMWEDIRRYVDESGEPMPALTVLPRRRIGYRLAVAGVLVAVAVTGGLLWWKGKRLVNGTNMVFDRPVVMPSRFGAVVELGDGRMIGLDTVATGAVVVRDGGVVLTKADSNSYVYAGGGTAARQRLSIAPGGGVLRIQWPDGSKAWLDKGSSLEYATDLRSAAARIRGEAWFRVTHHAARPVMIGMAGGTLVRVLGTSFDVQAIPGSPERVALFSGRLRVLKGTDSVLLNPGSQLEAGDSVLRVTHGVDSNAMLAMLPEIAGWWRVTVVNPQQLRGASITCGMPRNRPLAEIVKDLTNYERKYVHITLKDDTIYVAAVKPGG